MASGAGIKAEGGDFDNYSEAAEFSTAAVRANRPGKPGSGGHNKKEEMWRGRGLYADSPQPGVHWAKAAY